MFKFKRNSNKVVAVITSLFALTTLTVEAKLCKTTTSDGQTAFLFEPNTKGLVVPTKTLTGTVTALAQCKVTEVKVVKEIVETYVVPNPINICEQQAVLVCEPSFKGLPIGDVSSLKNYCGFMLYTTKVNGEDTTLRYLNGQVYSGQKSADEGKSTVCNSPAIK